MKTIRLLLTLLSIPVAAAAADRPNILWIIMEDMSQDLGCYGNTAVTTPNMDRLAERGMKFHNVFTSGPACSPSRTGFSTGVFQTTLGAYHMRYSDELLPPLSEPVETLPQLLRRAGYRTGNLSRIEGTGTAKDDWLFREPEGAWDTHRWSEIVSHQPFFAEINMSESHRPFGDKARHHVAPAAVTLPPYYPDHPIAREDWAGYLEEVNKADEYVGAILGRLEREGLADNTIVFVFSDHGRPMIRAKNWLYDSGTQIPLIIYIPENLAKPARYRAGGEDRQLISGIDLPAQAISLAGMDIPAWMQGRPFLDADAQPREYVFTAVDRIGNIESQSRAIRSQRYKYIRNFKRPGSVVECTTPYRRAMHPLYHLLNIMGERGLLNPLQAKLLERIPAEELYDLENDPFETENLIGDPQAEAVHQKLKAELETWIRESGDRGFEPDSEAIVRHFQNYGVESMKKYGPAIEEARRRIEARFDNP